MYKQRGKDLEKLLKNFRHTILRAERKVDDEPPRAKPIVKEVHPEERKNERVDKETEYELERLLKGRSIF